MKSSARTVDKRAGESGGGMEKEKDQENRRGNWKPMYILNNLPQSYHQEEEGEKKRSDDGQRCVGDNDR